MIKIELFPDRTKVGRLILLTNDGHPVCGPFPALGLADNAAALKHHNPNRDSLLPYGDTPLGTYNFTLVKTALTPKRSYGPHGAIALDPTAGPALTAERNHRSGLLIHSGDPGKNNTLRPTHGCIRLYDDDMEILMEELQSYKDKMECVISNAPSGRASAALLEGFNFASDSDGVSDDDYPQSELKLHVHDSTPKEFTIDTDLKKVKSPLTADGIDKYFASRPAGKRHLTGIGKAVIAASEKYQVNATYIVAHAIWETGWGTSKIYRDKNNLFGYTAYDSSPYDSATKFASREECIEKVIPIIDKNYLTPGGKYFEKHPCLGNANYGMNVHYATDKNWGTGMASVARMLERDAK